MKTYTIKEILDNPKIIIFIENKEQFYRLSNIKELKLTDYYMGSYCYDPHSGDWSSSSTKTYPGAYDSDSIIITFEQIIENIPEKEENKPKFEVGKWYSFNWNWYSSNSTVIAKIREVNEESFSISWRSYLWIENDYNTFDRYKFKDISNIKELSLEEVQQYLPENHPNKFKTVQSFEVGKWYKKDGYYLKPKKIIGTNSQCNTEYISPEGKYHANNSGIDDLRTWKLLTDLTEIQQYLPEGHPDKITSDIKFEVGDWVVNLEKSISYNVNEICRVSKISKTLLACENKPQGEDYMKPSDKFRHATPEEIHRHLTFTGQIQQYSPNNHPDKTKSNQEFKVGDWVVVLEEDFYYSNSEKCPQKLMEIKEYGLPYRLLFKDGHNNSYEKIRHATEKEMQEYFGNIEAKTYEYFNETLDRMKWKTSKPSYHLLSIDDEELPMVNIIKTNTVKQLLNND